MLHTKFSVLIVDGSADQGISLAVARSLYQIPGVEIHVLAQKPWSSLRYSRTKKSYTVRKTQTDEQWLAAILELVQRHKIDLVLGLMEPGIQLCATYFDRLSQFTRVAMVPTAEAFAKAVDKWRLAQMMMKFNIPGPKTIAYTADQEFETRINEFAFPVLIKPIHGGSGIGIEFFDTKDELFDYLKQIPAPNPHITHIIQDFLPGYDIDCSILCQNGQIVSHTIQKGIVKRANRFEPASGIQFLKHDEVLSVSKQFAAALNWTGIAHIDLRYDERDGHIKLIEVNPRYWQSMMGSLMMGVNFPHLACQLGLGEAVDTPVYNYGRYFDFRGLLQNPRQLMQMVGRALIGRNDPSSPAATLPETDYQFALKDPVAELTRILVNRFDPPAIDIAQPVVPVQVVAAD